MTLSRETIYVADSVDAVLDRLRNVTILKGVASRENLKRDFFGTIEADSFDLKIFGWFLQIGIRVIGRLEPGKSGQTCRIRLEIKPSGTERIQLILYAAVCVLGLPLLILVPDPVLVAQYAIAIASYGAYIIYSRNRARSKIRRAIRGESS